MITQKGAAFILRECTSTYSLTLPLTDSQRHVTTQMKVDTGSTFDVLLMSIFVRPLFKMES